MGANNNEAKTLYALYSQLGLPVDFIQQEAGFTIFNLKELNLPLPYQSPSFRPDYFSFLFIKDGEGHYSIDNYDFAVETHSIYFTNPSNYRTFSWKYIEEIYLITFDEAFLKTYLSPDVFEEFPFLLTEIVTPKLADPAFFKIVEQIYLDIYREYIDSSTDKYRVIGHLLAVLLYRIKAYFWKDYNPIYEGNRSSQIVKSFKQLLEKHYRELAAGKVDYIFRLQDYAAAQHLHPNYLSNVIKAKTGKSIASWMAEKTVAEAKVLLQHSTKSIKEIAYRLGFSEVAHFSNYFKKHTSMSPIQYRKAQGDSEFL